jgi:TolB-like protein/Flp pilus assembly protein TadD
MGITGAMIGALVFAAAVVAALNWSSPRSGEARPPPHVSIAVMPFLNLSDDREQQYFADGVTEDVTNDLSRLANMLVISRSTALTYRDKPIDAKQIGRELGVRYLLEGSVRRSGNQVRVNAQLIDAETDAHLWVERFDHNSGDLFALQDEITRRIAVALNLQLIDVEAARLNEHPGALDYIFRGRALYSGKSPSRDNYSAAISFFERALALDPNSVEAQSLLAVALVGRVTFGWAETAAVDIQRAEELARKALGAAPRNWFTHFARAQVLRWQGRPEAAISEYETLLAFNRNWVPAIVSLGICKMWTGSIEDTIPLLEHAIRLSPRDPYIAYWHEWIGRVHLLQSQIDEAIVWLEKARSANPESALRHSLLASAYALKGDMQRASAELTETRSLSRDGRFSSIARLKAAGSVGGPGYWGVPAVRTLFDNTYFAGLRKAGMQED